MRQQVKGLITGHSGQALDHLSSGCPRWLSVWGLVGTVLCLTAGLLVLFRFIAVLSSTQVALSLPIAAQEMVLAVCRS